MATRFAIAAVLISGLALTACEKDTPTQFVPRPPQAARLRAVKNATGDTIRVVLTNGGERTLAYACVVLTTTTVEAGLRSYPCPLITSYLQPGDSTLQQFRNAFPQSDSIRAGVLVGTVVPDSGTSRLVWATVDVQ